MSSLASPLGFVSIISKEWKTGRVGCIWYAFLTTWFGLSAMLHLAAMAVERYVILSKSNLSTIPKTRVIRIIASCWLFSFASSSFPLIGWSKYTFEGYGFHCSVLWDSQTANNASYNLFLFVTFFTIPIIVIVVSYTKVYFNVRGLYRNAGEIWGAHAQATKDSYHAEVKTVKHFPVVIAGFMLSWTPYSIVSLFKIVGGFDFPLAFQEYPAMFAKMSVVYNPLLYFFSNHRLRAKAIQILKVGKNVVHSVSEFDSQMAQTIRGM